MKTLIAPTVSILAVFFALLLSNSSQAADENALERAQRNATDLVSDLERMEQEIENARQRLIDDEGTLRTEDITINILEQARLDIAAKLSRKSGLKTRLLSRRETLAQLNDDIDQSQAELAKLIESSGEAAPQNGDNPLETDTETPESLRESLNEKIGRRDALIKIVATLETMQVRADTRVSLARQRFTILQSRFNLPNLDDIKPAKNAALKAILRDIDRLLDRASDHRHDAVALSESIPRELAAKRLLELQALDAEERAEFKQNELKLLRAAQILRSLDSFANTPATPGRVLHDGRDTLTELKNELEAEKELLQQKQKVIADQKLIAKQQGRIVQGGDSTLEKRLKLVDELAAESKERVAATDKVLASIEETRKHFDKAIVESRNQELRSRQELPNDAYGWRTVGKSLSLLPGRIGQSYASATTGLADSFKLATSATKLALLLLVGGLIIGIYLARAALARQLAQATADEIEALAPLSILQRSLWFWLAPALVWVITWLLNTPAEEQLLLLAPFLIIPAARTTTDFADTLLDAFTPELNPSKTRLLIRETHWVVMLAATLAGVLVIAHVVAISPVVEGLINRVSMLCLLLIALPLLHLRHLVIKGQSGDVGSKLVRFVSLLLPLTLIVCAIIGLSGYVNLAWEIARFIGITVGVGVTLLFAIDALSLLFSKFAKRLRASQGASAEFWIKNILGPIERLTQLAFVGVAGLTCYTLFEWNDQTPIIGSLPLVMDYTLFSVGETGIKVSNFVMAALLIFVVFWAGSWSKEVSYKFAFTRIGDVGIRNSLSTFTQYLVVVAGLMIALKTIGLDLTALTVFAGALGVGIGFGMQQIVVNFISGILLLIERPLATTDLVNVDKYEGEVTHIGIRSLTVKTWDNQEVIIPNSSVITKPFINWTKADDVMRTVLEIGISYDDDPHAALKLIEKVIRAHPAVTTVPAPKFLLWNFADSAVILRTHFFTHIRGAVGRADVKSQILFAIWDGFKEEGITIPYPQRDVHIRGEGKDAGPGVSLLGEMGD